MAYKVKSLLTQAWELHFNPRAHLMVEEENQTPKYPLTSTQRKQNSEVKCLYFEARTQL